MHSGIWGGFAERLAQSRTVHEVNLPGHGGSDFEPGWDAAGFARQLLDGPLAHVADADWIGWSLGGQVVLGAARRAPERCAHLVLMGFNPCFVAREGWSDAMPPGFLREFARACERDPEGTVRAFLGLQLVQSDGAKRALRALRSLQAAAPLPETAALLRGLELLADVSQLDLLAAVGQPTLWLSGEQDRLAPAAASRRAAALMSKAQVSLIPGAGHAPFLSHESEVCQAVEDFLGEDWRL
jgi:pimeloyl-[acyl-carrier protein] methyl ester esterase